MTLLVTGSIGIDTVKTPFGLREDCLGGSSVYCSYAASFFSRVLFLGVVGDDCPFDLVDFFAGRDVDMRGLEVRSGSKTFRWQGSYVGAMNQATTDGVELNVLAEEPAKLPENYLAAPCAFLANTHPGLQLKLLEELKEPKLVVADTMNLWIENERDALLALLQRLNGLVLNEGEAVMLSGRDNLVAAGKAIIQMGPEFVVIKKGEHGTLLLTRAGEISALPAYPTDAVTDPTGAGDSFAGGMMGYLAGLGRFPLTPADFKAAIAYGTAVASLVIEDFTLDRWHNAGRDDIDQRLKILREMVKF